MCGYNPFVSMEGQSLKIDVTEIIDQPGASISFSETGRIALGEGNEDIATPAPFTVKGVATSTGEGIYVQANIRGTVGLTCSRCLREFEMPIEFDCEGRFVEDPEELELNDDEDDVETFAMTDGYCVLDDLVQHGLVLNIPMKPLCDEECKGLCDTCGVNLNETTCQCGGPGAQATLFGRKLLEALEERGKKNGSSKEEDF